jgi:hypothetical protein
VDNGDWSRWAGQVVVVDTDSDYLYLGTLDKVLDHFIVLKDADAHDRRESPSTKEQYTIDSKRYGVKVNRKEVQVRKDKIVSFSRLEDVVVY